MEEKTWIVPVEWMMTGYVAVKAPSAEEACSKVDRDNSNIKIPSSPYAQYMDDSFMVPGEEDDIWLCEYLTDLYNTKKRPFNLLNDL